MKSFQFYRAMNPSRTNLFELAFRDQRAYRGHETVETEDSPKIVAGGSEDRDGNTSDELCKYRQPFKLQPGTSIQLLDDNYCGGEDTRGVK